MCLSLLEQFLWGFLGGLTPCLFLRIRPVRERVSSEAFGVRVCFEIAILAGLFSVSLETASRIQSLYNGGSLSLLILQSLLVFQSVTRRTEQSPDLVKVGDRQGEAFLSHPLQVNSFDAFISYHHGDQDFARSLCCALERRGLRIWFDEQEISDGEDLYAACVEGIRQSRKFLLCASQNSLASWWVNKEIEHALQKEKELWSGQEAFVLIPLDLDGVLRSGHYTGKFKELLQWRRVMDVAGWRVGSSQFELQVERLYRALRSEVQPVSEPEAPT